LKHVLFVCGKNKLRSPTAEAIFAQWPGVDAQSAGLSNDAITPVSSDLIEWAHVIVVMEQIHRSKLTGKFKAYLKGKKLVVLDIPDVYEYMQPELVQLLKAKVPKYAGI